MPDDSRLPGTAARLEPRPEPVTAAVALVDEGVRSQAAERLAGRYDADQLRHACWWWTRRMPTFRWDDYRDLSVLAVLEEALARVSPRTKKSGRSGPD